MPGFETYPQKLVPVAGDKLIILDVSDTSDSPAGTTKSCDVADLPVPVAIAGALAALESLLDLKLDIAGFTASAIKSMLGITTLSGSNTGDQNLEPYELKSNKNNSVLNNSATEFPTSALVKEITDEVRDIANGRAKSKTVDTLAELDAWLAIPANVATLNPGDNLYIRDLNTPDYWWDGTHKQELEVSAPNLSDYVPTTRLINGKDLSANVDIAPADITGFNTAVLSAAPAETLISTATLINSATEKTTLVDADVGVMLDSAASNTFKKFTLATLWDYIDTKAAAVYQGRNIKLDAIGDLATTAGSAIVGNGTTFVLQALGNAAGKNVGTTSTDVAAGDRGLPVTAADGQVPAYNATLGAWVAATISGGSSGSGWGYALLSMTYSYRTSTTLNPTAASILTSSISGLATTEYVTGFTSVTLTLPAGTYRIQIIFKCATAGKVDATPYFYDYANPTSGSLVTESDAYNFGFGTAAASSTNSQYNISTKIVTLASAKELLLGNAIADFGGGIYRVTIGGTSFTSSTTCKASIEIFKLA